MEDALIDESEWLATLPVVRGIPLCMLRALEGHDEPEAEHMVDMWGRDLETLATLKASWRTGSLPEPYAALREASSGEMPPPRDLHQTRRRVSALVACPPVQWAPWSVAERRRAAMRALIAVEEQWSQLAQDPLVAAMALAVASDEALELQGDVLVAHGRTLRLGFADRRIGEQLVSGRMEPMAAEEAAGLPLSLIQVLGDTNAGLMLGARDAIAARDELRCASIRAGWRGAFVPLRLAAQFGRVESVSLYWGASGPAITEARWRSPAWTMSFGVDVHPAVAMNRESPHLLVTTEGWASGELSYMDRELSSHELLEAQEAALERVTESDWASIPWSADEHRSPEDLPLLPLAYGEDGAWWKDSHRMWAVFVDYLFRFLGLSMPAHLPGFGWFHPAGARWPD